MGRERNGEVPAERFADGEDVVLVVEADLLFLVFVVMVEVELGINDDVPLVMRAP